MRPRSRLAVIATATTLVVAAAASVYAAERPSRHEPWPYAPQAGAPVLAAVGDVACEPDNATTDPYYTCGGGHLPGKAAAYATADQVEAMHPALVALLGDEQYETGKLSDFEASFDKTYGAFKFLQRPAPGNHEFYPYAKNKNGHAIDEPGQDGAGYFGYYNGQDAGGAVRPAGQAGDAGKGWYSYDLGKWHVISLNAECDSDAFGHNCDPTKGLLGQETKWLAADLAADHDHCTLAYWHQPTFTAMDEPSTEGDAARAWWKLLYADKADLILNGHEHLYARSAPQDPAGKADATRGIRQFIVGTGGEDLDTVARGADGKPSDPNVVTGYDQGFGAMKLTLGRDGYAWNFKPTYAAPGAAANALDYRDSGSARCH